LTLPLAELTKAPALLKTGTAPVPPQPNVCPVACALKVAPAALVKMAPLIRLTVPPVQVAVARLLRVRPSRVLPAGPLMVMPPWAVRLPVPLTVPAVQLKDPLTAKVSEPERLPLTSVRLAKVRDVGPAAGLKSVTPLMVQMPALPPLPTVPVNCSG